MPKFVALADLAQNNFVLKGIKSLGLAVRTADCLQDNGILYAADLIQKSEADLLKIPLLRKRPLNALKGCLATMGLELDTRVTDLPEGANLRDALEKIQAAQSHAGIERFVETIGAFLPRESAKKDGQLRRDGVPSAPFGAAFTGNVDQALMEEIGCLFRKAGKEHTAGLPDEVKREMVKALQRARMLDVFTKG